MKYPETRTVDATDVLAGITTADPYRWLEDSASEEVRLWQKQQNELASSTVRAYPGFDRLRSLVEANTTARFGARPRSAGGRWFRSVDSRVVVSDSPLGDGDVVVDATGAFLSWIQPSPDGRLLAYGVCADGSEQNDLHLVDVATGDELPVSVPRLMDNWTGGVSWLADSSGFYVTVIDGAAIDLAQRVLHVAVSGEVAQVDVAWQTATEYRMVQVSHDGRLIVAYEGMTYPTPIAVAEVADPAAPVWQPFVAGDGRVVAGHFFGDTYVAITDVDAPRGRVVAIRRDAPEEWTTLVPESDAVLRTLVRVGDLAYVIEFVDTYARVRVFDTTGNLVGTVPLPGDGAIGEFPFPFQNLVPGPDPDSFVFSFSTLTSSWGVYRHRPGAAEVEVLSVPDVVLEGVVVEDHWATSKDGWRVPYHLVRPAAAQGIQPTLVYAYGGFNAPWVPQFPGAMAAFVAAGGTFVHAHLRGGGEFGREGWELGRLSNKQNGYDDLYAVAEDLITQGLASPHTLAVTGGSNGGLMSGVAVTQRPDLWKAVVPRVPILDLVGACRENYARYAISVELAHIDDPQDVQRMLTVSPYHCVESRDYPAVFLDAGDTDPRCSPWHARKFGALLQASQTGDAPVLVRIWENVGHGWATDKDLALEQSAEWLAFVCQQLRLDI